MRLALGDVVYTETKIRPGTHLDMEIKYGKFKTNQNSFFFFLQSTNIYSTNLEINCKTDKNRCENTACKIAISNSETSSLEVQAERGQRQAEQREDRETGAGERERGGERTDRQQRQDRERTEIEAGQREDRGTRSGQRDDI